MDTGAKPNIFKPLRVSFGYYILHSTAMTQVSPETLNMGLGIGDLRTDKKRQFCVHLVMVQSRKEDSFFFCPKTCG